MAHKYLKTLFTETIRKTQEELGSREGYQRMENGPVANGELSSREINFISQRDSFYMATITEDNWPYTQHRGGPIGFVKILSPTQIGFSDYSGNRQYISVGNIKTNNRASIIMVDYPNRRRLKIVGELEAVSEKSELANKIKTDNYKATVERFLVMNIIGFDWNCPQHITPRFTLDELAAASIEKSKHKRGEL